MASFIWHKSSRNNVTFLGVEAIKNGVIIADGPDAGPKPCLKICMPNIQNYEIPIESMEVRMALAGLLVNFIHAPDTLLRALGHPFQPDISGVSLNDLISLAEGVVKAKAENPDILLDEEESGLVN